MKSDKWDYDYVYLKANIWRKHENSGSQNSDIWLWVDEHLDFCELIIYICLYCVCFTGTWPLFWSHTFFNTAGTSSFLYRQDLYIFLPFYTPLYENRLFFFLLNYCLNNCLMPSLRTKESNMLYLVYLKMFLSDLWLNNYRRSFHLFS